MDPYLPAWLYLRPSATVFDSFEVNKDMQYKMFDMGDEYRKENNLGDDECCKYDV